MWSIRLLVGLVGVTICLAGEETMSTGVRVLNSIYRQCEVAEDSFLCLKGRALKLVDRAIHADNIPLLDGVALVRRPESERSFQEPMDPLPNDVEPRQVDDLLWDRVTTFMETHSIQFRLPSFIREAIWEDGSEEGRGKKKKLIGPLLLGMLFKGSLIAITLKGLALLAGKALIISKLALVLAGIIALKKLFSGGGEKTTYEIVKQPIVSHSHQYSTSHEDGGFEHGGYGRSLETAQELAYAAQIPPQEKQ